MNRKNVNSKTALVFKTKTNLKEVSNVAMTHLPKMYETLAKASLEEKEPSIFIYKDVGEDMEKDFVLEIALITDTEKKLEGPYQFEKIAPIECASFDYKGDMQGLTKRYEEVFQEISKAEMIPSNEVREVYHNWIGEASKENEIEIQVGLN